MSSEISFAINHITCPTLPYDELIELAEALGCAAVQFRNDLNRPLFEGDSPALVKQKLDDAGLRMLSLAEVKRFNDSAAERIEQGKRLIDIAVRCGAEGVSLIPANDAAFQPDAHQRRANLTAILEALADPLADAGLRGMVEPLGFSISSLRTKAEAVAVIDALDLWNTYRLVHDTFHHYLAGEQRYYPQHTGILEISGVVDPNVSVEQMGDEHRILVTEDDRIQNIEQIRAMLKSGYSGCVSYECFAPSVHRLTDPKTALSQSMQYIRQMLG
jgi:2-keto-myo-inositol isomerase